MKSIADFQFGQMPIPLRGCSAHLVFLTCSELNPPKRPNCTYLPLALCHPVPTDENSLNRFSCRLLSVCFRDRLSRATNTQRHSILKFTCTFFYVKASSRKEQRYKWTTPKESRSNTDSGSALNSRLKVTSSYHI